MSQPLGETLMQTLTRAALAAGFLAMLGAAPAAAQSADYEIIAPAAPGGGWDQTARAMQETLQTEKIAGSVQVVNVPGAGGTIGLSQFASDAAGDPNKLIVGGYVMVGAILTNQSPTTLADVTPIARLTGEYEALVVPADSEIGSVADIVAQLKADPGAVTWGGGSAGGTDNIAAGLIAKAVGVDPTAVNYVPFSGGGEALAAILGGQVTVGISSFSEFEAQVTAGALRLIAVSSPERIAGLDAPTLKESGIDVDIQNWRMVAAAPDITAEQKAKISADVEAMVKSGSWQELLKTRGWSDTYLSGEAFDAQLQKDVAATESVLKDLGLVQ